MFPNSFMENITKEVDAPAADPFKPFKKSTVYYSSFVVFILFTGWLTKIKRRKLTENQRNIPKVLLCPIKIPFLHAWYHPLKLGSGGVKIIEDIVRQYGSIFEIPFGLIKLIGVTDPLVIKKVLTSTNGSHLSKPRYIYGKIFENLLSNGLLALDHPTWFSHRKVANQAFTYKSLKVHLKIMNQHAKRLVTEIHKKVANNMTQEEVNIHGVTELIDFHILGIIAEVLWGQVSSSDEGNLDIQRSIHRAKEITIYRFTHPELFLGCIWKLHPKKWELDGIWRMLTETLKLYLIYDFKIGLKNIETIKAKNQQNSTNLLGPTTFKKKSNGIETNDDSDIGEKPVRCLMEEMISSGMSDNEIYSEIATFLLAGFETTAVTINMLLFHLASNPDIQAKCQDEVDILINSKKNDGNSEFEFLMEDLTKLKYLERCVQETLRLTAVIPAFSRRLDAPLKVSEDLQFEAGQTILLLPWVLHRDSRHFAHPMKFLPDRFLPENTKGRDPYAFIAFSGGARDCIGRKFAMMQIKVLAALILKNFEISTMDSLDNIKFYFEASLRPEREIKMTLKKRNQ